MQWSVTIVWPTCALRSGWLSDALRSIACQPGCRDLYVVTHHINPAPGERTDGGLLRYTVVKYDFIRSLRDAGIDR